MANCWIKQRNNYSCGPVALMNLNIWLGNPISYACDYVDWFARCKCDRQGSPLAPFVESLYGIEGIKVRRRNVPTIEIIDNALVKNKVVVMKSAISYKGETMGHYFLVTERKENSFFCVNYSDKHGWLKKTFFENYYLNYHAKYCEDCGVAPYAWIVSKVS